MKWRSEYNFRHSHYRVVKANSEKNPKCLRCLVKYRRAEGDTEVERHQNQCRAKSVPLRQSVIKYSVEIWNSNGWLTRRATAAHQTDLILSWVFNGSQHDAWAPLSTDERSHVFNRRVARYNGLHDRQSVIYKSLLQWKRSLLTRELVGTMDNFFQCIKSLFQTIKTNTGLKLGVRYSQELAKRG